jgi:uncharacterized damage-inducible protein DinB
MTTATPAFTQAALAELHAEGATTRALPADKLSWKPHEKSMSLASLASHVATIPCRLSSFLAQDEFDFATAGGFDEPATKEAILEQHDEAMAAAHATLERWTPEQLAAEWRAHKEGTPIFAMPRAGAARALLFNHWYHHRGQLSVYLRLLDVPVPSVYGPTADVNPFE